MGQIFTAAMQFQQQRTAADIAESEGKVAAQQEEVAAVQREADRKSRLATAMASQTASAGARGVAAFEGSPLSVLQEDIRREGVATERDVMQTRLAAMTARQRGKIQSSLIKSQATIGLLQDLDRAAASASPGGGAK